MSGFTERIVPGACALAVRDFGGSGSPVLLLHGATRALTDWTPIAQRLVAGHRVVAMDFRGHGHSDGATWNWEQVFDDIDRVIEATGLNRPALVGHSLGGMTAALYNARGRECTCVVNIDGYGHGRPHQYLGIPEEEVRAYQEDSRRVVRAHSRRTSTGLDRAAADAFRAAAMKTATAVAIPADLAAATIDRTMRQLPDGTYTVRPDADALDEILDRLAEISWIDIYEKVTAPFLTYLCLADAEVPGRPPREADLMAAYRRGLQRDIAGIAARSPNVRARMVRTHHMLILTMPDELAAEIHEFVESTR